MWNLNDVFLSLADPNSSRESAESPQRPHGGQVQVEIYVFSFQLITLTFLNPILHFT